MCRLPHRVSLHQPKITQYSTLNIPKEVNNKHHGKSAVMVLLNTSFREKVHGEMRLSPSRLQKEYGIDDYACGRLRAGISMSYENEMNLVRINLLQYPDEHTRLYQLIAILDAQREDDIARYGKSAIPFSHSIISTLESEITRRAKYQDARYFK